MKAWGTYIGKRQKNSSKNPSTLPEKLKLEKCYLLIFQRNSKHY
jgi:hypothetical protein